MSATAFQKKRRELEEQTSVAARLNEDGPGDPYAKTLDNYDEIGVKDTGTEHQEGNPPPYSETGHVPEQLDQSDQGTLHQQGDPPLTSVELREGESPNDGVYEDEARYDALDVRDEATAEASEENAESGLDSLTAPELKERAKAEGIKGYSSMNKPELIAALEGE